MSKRGSGKFSIEKPSRSARPEATGNQMTDPVYELGVLLDGITEANRHPEIRTHVAIGAEFH
jgi:hypothetical protein